MLLTIVVTLLVFGLIVLLHELGHFLAARHCGVRVEEFAIGFGPALLQHRRRGTLYSLRLLPFGGYNLLAQEYTSQTEDEAETKDAPAQGPAPKSTAPTDTAAQPPAGRETVCVEGCPFPQAGVWQRFFIIAAGALMNFLLGFVLLIFLQASQELLPTRVIHDFLPGATSQATGLQAGDKILRVGGHACFTWGDLYYELDSAHYAALPMTVLRNGARVELPAVKVTPLADADGNQLPFDFHVTGVARTPRTVLQSAGGEFLYYARILLRSFLDLFTGRTGVEELSGPVGIVNAVGQAVRFGWQDVLSLAILLTINLGIFNLLPVPGLDGGKLLFLAIEGLSGHKPPERLEQAVTLAGLLLLICLMFYVTMQDISNLL